MHLLRTGRRSTRMGGTPRVWGSPDWRLASTNTRQARPRRVPTVLGGTCAPSAPVRPRRRCAARADRSPAGAGTPDSRGAVAVEVALIADTPYGEAQRQQFPALVDTITADPQVRMVLHAGDVKSGSSTCDDGRFADLAALYETFSDPFVLTPGDNEWTDCHRTAAGGYLPTERLDDVRRVFYPEPGRTLGRRSRTVTTQAQNPAHAAYVENVRFTRSRVTVATVHVVGSENALDPWSQLPGGDRPDLRLAEFQAREAAAHWTGSTPPSTRQQPIAQPACCS